MRAIITRHYKTLINEAGRILGWGDSPPVPGWQADLDFVDARLRDHQIGIDGIYSSDLERSRQTAMYYARSRGIAAVNHTPMLNEVHYGNLNKKKKNRVAAEYPQHKKNPDLVYPEGESFRQMQQRSVRFLSSLISAHPLQTVLIVAHAGVIRGIVSHFLGLNFADNLEHKIPFRYIGDFEFDETGCSRYDELGKPSGFVRKSIIEIPCPGPGTESLAAVE